MPCFPAGCSKRSSSKAAASEKPKRTLCSYVEALSDARTQLAVVFNNLTKEGATGFDGDTDAIVACRALGVS